LLRKAVFDHQVQPRDVIKEITSILVMPPDVLELREEKDGALANIPISGGLVKTVSEDQMYLELYIEEKLE
jgi:hypothetical protein